MRVRATGVTDKPGLRKIAAASKAVKGAMRGDAATIDCVFDGRRCRATLIARDEIRSGDSLSGPAVISEYSATTLSARLDGRVDAYGQILLTPEVAHVAKRMAQSTRAGRSCAPGRTRASIRRVSKFSKIFHSVAEEMGAALRRSAFSPNIKERRDYSCAVFEAEGSVLAMGDHMPVHLGSMPMSVAAARAAFALEPGDIALLNDPYAGGTHLPDLTMVMPVYIGATKRCCDVVDRIRANESRRQRAPHFMSPIAPITPISAARRRAPWDSRAKYFKKAFAFRR